MHPDQFKGIQADGSTIPDSPTVPSFLSAALGEPTVPKRKEELIL
jgi:hypothetical protein